jgi:hypothetical protein
VARLQVEALRASNDALQARSEVARARQALALLTGMDSRQAQLPLADGWPAMVAAGTLAQDGAAGAGSDAAIARRPDVMAAQARVAAATSAHKLALAARTRDVSVGVQAEHYPASAGNPQGSGNSFGISLQVPLFLRYQYDGEIRGARRRWTWRRKTWNRRASWPGRSWSVPRSTCAATASACSASTTACCRPRASRPGGGIRLPARRPAHRRRARRAAQLPRRAARRAGRPQRLCQGAGRLAGIFPQCIP